jgi:hypothetical protein
MPWTILAFLPLPAYFWRRFWPLIGSYLVVAERIQSFSAASVGDKPLE